MLHSIIELFVWCVQESGPVKTHKVKKKSKASKTNSEHWNDLFTLPSREGALTGLTTDEDDSMYVNIDSSILINVPHWHIPTYSI